VDDHSGMAAFGGDTTALRRLAGRSLAGGLCVAAAVAVLALLSGSFEETHWRVVGTSLGFSVFASTAAAGGALRLRWASWARGLGAATAVSSFAAFALLAAALWLDDDAEGLWRAFGVAGLLALWTSHASLVLRALRPDDTSPIRFMAVSSVAALGIDTSVGVLALLGALDDVDDDAFARVLAALLVVALLFTALPPLMRRFGGRTAAPAPAHPALGRSPDPFARQVAASADRLAAMELPVPARAEVERLRELARDAGG
jgi:hypothetical protein